jgi:trigger factor
MENANGESEGVETTQTEPLNSRNIPLPIQREVRQRCGFGCVICGLPLYEYEHLLGWANVKRHAADEITLLCDKHHREKTAGLLPIDAVREANDSPYNRREGVSKPYDLHYSGQDCVTEIGGNAFTTQDHGTGTAIIPVSIDDVPIVAFIMMDGHLLLNLNLFDEFNNLVLQIVHNQLFYSISPWDIQLVGRNLVIREAERNIIIDIVFAVPNRISINRGRFLCNGVELLIQPNYALITNNKVLFSRNIFTNFTGGLVIGRHTRSFGAAVRIDQVPRYLGDRSEAIRWAKEMLDHGTKS